jgi:MoaA/NifB/PqqE/SkfB family radical SAM enzyme
MARIILELTNRCNLRCGHCFGERHAGTGDLPAAIVERVLSEARACGIDHICFTGGEPTLYRGFKSLVERTCAAGYTFSFVSNGRRFPSIASWIGRHREQFRGVTFSLDGAREATHDRLRGDGSYRDVMRAATACVFRKLPFTLNMVVTAQNAAEVEEYVLLGAQLGSRGVRFGHLMSSPDATSGGRGLSASERLSIESRIWDLRKRSRVPVAMAPGYFSASPLFPCAPLELEEFNINYRGRLTLCCQLSGHDDLDVGDDLVADLHHVTLREARTMFDQRVAAYLAEKRERVENRTFGDLDYFPCWYCVKHVGRSSLSPRRAAPIRLTPV